MHSYSLTYPDCSATLCAFVMCGAGEQTYTPEGQCCPACRPGKHEYNTIKHTPNDVFLRIDIM